MFKVVFILNVDVRLSRKIILYRMKSEVVWRSNDVLSPLLIVLWKTQA
jgi:hypothetical protein